MFPRDPISIKAVNRLFTRMLRVLPESDWSPPVHRNRHRNTMPNSFAEEIICGLQADPKYLPSKYFYDDEGSRLFQEIMQLPEYYLTNSEFEIFTNHRETIFQTFNSTEETYDLIELGAGDGTKTAVLVDYFLQQSPPFHYVPIDISAQALTELHTNFSEQFKQLAIEPKLGDYFHILENFALTHDKKKLILFLGSNIGNFSERQALDFFKKLRRSMSPQDRLLTGFDLHKNPKTILNAYDDSQGITAKFNLNLLKNINRELEADFDLEEFTHYASYHPLECAARSFLISRKQQTVTLQALELEVNFGKWEPIYMEVSQKYRPETIEQLAEASGFGVVENFYDNNRFFVDSLWQPV